MPTPSPATIEYVSYLKRALLFDQINERDFYPFSPIDASRSLLSSSVKGTQLCIDLTFRAWAYGQMSAGIVQEPKRLLKASDAIGGPAPSDFVDDLRRSLLHGGLTYTDLSGFYIPPYGATFWRDFTKFQTLNHGTGIPLTCTRSGSASYIGPGGQMKIAQVDEPRFDYDPVTLECKGLLSEVARKNFVLQSTFGVTQTIALASGTYTLSFYGSGTIILTGSATGSLIGAGAYPARSTLTFTSASGNLVMTVSGSTQYVQIESGSFATSWIPTGSTPSLNDTRAQDLIVSSSEGLPTSVFNAVRGTLYCSFSRYNVSALRAGFLQFRGSPQNFVGLQGGSTNPTAPYHEFRERPGNETFDSTVRNLTPATVGTIYKLAGSYDNTIPSFKLFQNGANVGTVLSSFTNLPVGISTVMVGRVTVDGSTHGWIRQLSYMPSALSDTDLSALTT